MVNKRGRCYNLIMWYFKLLYEGDHMSKAKNKGFFVLEQEDCEKYLTVTEQNILWELQKKVLAGRHVNGKNMREKYIVINKSDETFKEIRSLLAELKELDII